MFVYIKRDKSNLWQRILYNVEDSVNGVKVLACENRGTWVLMIVAIVILAIIVVITRLVSGEWFNVLEWLIVIGEMFLLLVTETLNFAIEILCDRVTTEDDNAIKNVKDVASAAVYFWIILVALTTIFFVVCHACHFAWYEMLT